MNTRDLILDLPEASLGFYYKCFEFYFSLNNGFLA